MHFHLVAFNIQLSVRKHYIQFTLINIYIFFFKYTIHNKNYFKSFAKKKTLTRKKKLQLHQYITYTFHQKLINAFQ